MGNSLAQHRAAIGLYYNKCRCTTKLLLFRLFDFWNSVDLFIEQSHHYILRTGTCFLSVITQETLFVNYLFQILYAILMLSGDVESNPGPSMMSQFTLDIFHLNIRSIRNKIDLFLNLVTDFDILCFTETHLDTNISNDNIAIEGFNTVFRKDRNAYGGGVIIYASDSLRISRCENLEPIDTECVWTEISDPTCNILLCCVYRPLVLV